MTDIPQGELLNVDKDMLEEVIVQTLLESGKVTLEDVHDVADALLNAILNYEEGFEV